MEQKKEKRRIKPYLGMAYKSGLELGAQSFIDNYDKYRRYSGWFWMSVAIISWIFFRRDDIALVSFGIMHLTILFNQLWWKIKNIEHYYINKGDGDRINKE